MNIIDYNLRDPYINTRYRSNLFSATHIVLIFNDKSVINCQPVYSSRVKENNLQIVAVNTEYIFCTLV